MLFRQLPGALWATDCDLRLTYIIGRLADDAAPVAKPGMTLYEVVRDREGLHTLVAAHFAALSGESRSVERHIRGHWYRAFVEPLKDDEGKLIGCVGAGFEITEQHETQERLERSEHRLAQAQRVANIGSFEWDVDANVVTWSDELEHIYGLSPGEFDGTYEAFLKHVHPEDLEQAKSVLFDALRQGSAFDYEHRIIRQDGAVRSLHTRGDVSRNEDGKAVRMVGCSWDVTELRNAMNNLQRARSLLEAALEATADGLLVVDRKDGVTAYNEKFLQLWGIPCDVASEHDAERMRSYILEKLENAEEFLAVSHELHRHPERETSDVDHLKDGRVFERDSRPQRVGEQIVGRVWSVRDITEREMLLRRAMFLADATRLLGSLEIKSALTGVAHLAVPFIGDACAVDYFGDGAPGRLAFVSLETVGSFSPGLDEAVIEGNSLIYSAGIHSCLAVPLITKEGIAGAITFVAAPMRKYGKPDLEVAEALARRAALAVENARLFREAREAVKARDEFLTIAAHEIRGPLTSIHMAVQGLQSGKTPASATEKMLEIIEREDRRLARFVDDLVNLGKIQSGQLNFELEEVNLGNIVREAAIGFADEQARSGSTLSITTEGRPVGQWDKYGLSQVATNLLSNAIKFGEGKPIVVTVIERDGRTTLEVQDHGIGIAPEMLDRLFKPFERGVSIRHYGGLGLGLFIAQTIVENLGGTIRVRSKLGEGSTFTVELPNTRVS
jgi:PAS domain S-box-containing protein